MKTLKAIVELRYIRAYHPEVVNRKVIDQAIAELKALENRSCENCKYYRGIHKEDISCKYWGYVSTYVTTPSSMLCKEWEGKQ